MDIWDRFWSKVEEPFDAHNDCWIWKAAKDPNGYGRFNIGSKKDKTHRMVYAHVFSWEFFNGPIPKGYEVHHDCKNKLCQNGSHLELMTHADHARLSLAGTQGVYQRAKTHCKHGHLLSGNNLYVGPDGKRDCRECNRIKDRKRRKRQLELRRLTQKPGNRHS